MTLPGRDQRASWVISSTGKDQVEQRYDAWAEEYDADLQAYGYQSSALVAGIVGRHVPRGAAPALGAGAGTGNVGLALVRLGDGDLTAIDLSVGMLAVGPTRRSGRWPWSGLGLPRRPLRGDGVPGDLRRRARGSGVARGVAARHAAGGPHDLHGPQRRGRAVQGGDGRPRAGGQVDADRGDRALCFRARKRRTRRDEPGIRAPGAVAVVARRGAFAS